MIASPGLRHPRSSARWTPGAPEAVEASLPEPAVVLEPVGSLVQRRSLQSRGPELRGAAARDQAGALEHPEVLRDGLYADRERLGELVHRRLALVRGAPGWRASSGSASAANVVVSWSAAMCSPNQFNNCMVADDDAAAGRTAAARRRGGSPWGGSSSRSSSRWTASWRTRAAPRTSGTVAGASRSSSGDEGREFKVEETRASDAQLLGRVTYEGFAEAWPSRDGEFADLFNSMPKYVVSSTLTDPSGTTRRF